MVGHHDVHFKRHFWMMSLAMDYVICKPKYNFVQKYCILICDYTISMLRLNFSVNYSLFLKISHLHKIKSQCLFTLTTIIYHIYARYLHCVHTKLYWKKYEKTEHMIRMKYNVIQNYAKKMAARSKKRFQFDNILLLELEGSNVF